MGLVCTLYALSADDASSLVAGDLAHQPCMLDCCELDKAWGAIHYFISGSGDASPDNPRLEDFLVSGALLGDISEHSAVHTPAEVAEFARKIETLSVEQLIARFDSVRMNELDVYGKPWDESGRNYVLQFLEPFREFIFATAAAKRALLVVIC